MKIIRINDCAEFTAGDKSCLKEIFNPLKEKLSLSYSLAHALVQEGQSTEKHKLLSSEVYYILSGKGIMHIDDKFAEVKSDDTVYIPPHPLQWIENPGKEDLIFLCIVEPAWQPSVEQVL